ncbi:MAG: hypothetical protein B6U78_02175 [Candidatus Aenigmarchaeota archaeon ex4484_224]|nr:MAG: hypothetical protein B6U78_02175 [Candidatus Aenigmarchaeota archaeon ex4484_224]
MSRSQRKDWKGRIVHKSKKIKNRMVEIISLPGILISAFVLRFFVSFVSFIKAVLLTWGFMDGVVSNYLYKEEKFFPYQFLRYGRIAANLSGIINPVIPVIWNIGDGLYSLYIYRNKALPMENVSRYGRILNGALLAIL